MIDDLGPELPGNEWYLSIQLPNPTWRRCLVDRKSQKVPHTTVL